MDLKTNSVAPTSGLHNPFAFSSAWAWGVPLFALLAMLVLLVTGSNQALFLSLNHFLAQFGDSWWSHITILGDTSAIIFVLPLLGRRPDIFWQFVLAALFASLWSVGGKELFSSLRPPSVLQEGTFHLIGPMFEFNSFPSGHTTTIFVLAGLLCAQCLDIRLKFSVLLLAVLVGLSRIACGVHWPLDVLGGMLGGWGAALAGVWLAQHWHAGLNVWFQRVLALIIALLVLWSMFNYDNGFPDTRVFELILTAVCLAFSIKGLYRLFKIG